ncbi:MotA/TolQ/ExbB proton channel family protein [Rikenella microfusus]|uniref:Colicin uptake protein TolQ n=1 Tax=Rikenella microfusus TaxID=28139 RepID=A0A379MQW8_9BACT|nr:MotA/TolQ/ExbB proton channel family protein [Rikenella microfusus]SUE33913.1 colicin uptake protein TolQ [Rikenella microfusus]HJE88334.1 MotA/TolQ/ExbB proton channel family protein [Rikenella microfusus]
MMLLQAVQEAAKPETIGLGSLILAGGWLMIPLALLSAITIFIFFERFWMIRQASGKTDAGFMAKIRDLIYEGKTEQAIQYCRARRSPVARMIEKGIMNLGRSKADIQASIENVANLEVSRLESGLPFLATTAGGAPMIGFLGTVLGMVQAFMDMAAAGGSVDLSILASGMYTAMITTVGGLVVGIPAYFGYNFLVARIEKLVFQMEANTIAFMDIVTAGENPLAGGNFINR